MLFFSGSGTSVAVANRLGRRGIGFDLRRSQCEIGKRRVERPHAPIRRPTARSSEPETFLGISIDELEAP